MQTDGQGTRLNTSQAMDQPINQGHDAAYTSATFAEVIGRYDAVFLDVYGVLLNAEGLYSHTADLISWLQAEGKPFLLVSNGSSRTLAESAKAYRSKGLAVSEQEVMTSGALLKHWAEAEGLIGKKVHILGRSASYDVIAEAGLIPAQNSEDVAAVVVLNQAEPLLTQIDDALTLIIRQLDADKPLKLVVPNPDCLYPRGAQTFGITAGAIAELLEGALAKRYGAGSQLTFTRLGKPYPLIFSQAIAKLSTIWNRPFAKERILMVGDQIATDIKGALEYGLGAMLYQGGVANIAKFKGHGLSRSDRSFYVSSDLHPPSRG